jgi:hypothetical protein
VTLDTRISRTGYVIRYNMPELWFACDGFGVVQMRGTTGLSADECRAMVTSGALVEHVRLLAGAVIYKLTE